MSNPTFKDPSLVEPGEAIDRWVVDAVLGAGAMARVYAVHHSVLDKKAAIKVLRTSSEEVQQRMVREGRVQNDLGHDNIVTVDDVLIHNDRPALVMELAQGPTLHRFLQLHKPTVDEALVLFGCILGAIRHAHENGVMHRDLKPANVLLHVDGDEVVPKVADFGLAKLLVNPVVDMTSSGIALGTPRYMAPEQALDAKRVDERADIFSLGCILYELICHQKCFGDDNSTVYKRMVEGDYPRPGELVPELDADVAQAIERCISGKPADRPGSCEELARLLYGPRGITPSRVPADNQVSVVARRWQLLRDLESEPAQPSSKDESEVLEELKDRAVTEVGPERQTTRNLALLSGIVAGMMIVFALATAYLLGGALN